MFALHLLALPPALGEQRQPGAHGALGVVFPGTLGAEHGELAVAGVLQHLAAVRLDDGGAALQSTLDHRMKVLGVEMLSQCRRADDVEKQH